MIKKMSRALCILLCMGLLAGCSNKETPGDPNKLESYLSTYESNYVKNSGELTSGQLDDYLQQLSVDAMKSRAYDIQHVEQKDQSLLFQLTGDVEYLYTPEGFDAASIESESEDETGSDAEADDMNNTEESGELTGVILDSDIPNPGLSVSSESASVVGGSSIEIDADSNTDEEDAYSDLGDGIDPSDYSTEELQVLRQRIAESQSVTDDESDTETDDKD